MHTPSRRRLDRSARPTRAVGLVLGTAALLLLAFAASARHTEASGPPASAQAGHTEAAGEHHAKHWAYEDGPSTVGPEHWSTIAGNGQCSAKRQSPTALASNAASASGDLLDTFAYRPSRVSLVNNGHTVQAGYDAGSSVSEGGAAYTLAQFHFHAPSEHTLDGRSYPLEIHLVHLDGAGKPALVVGVFVKEGRANAALESVFQNLPKHEGEKSEPAGATVDAAALLPADRSHFAYDGSLTTPPCSEGIRWRVMRQPIEMSASQIAAYRSLPHLAHTNRPVQPGNGRVVNLISQP